MDSEDLLFVLYTADTTERPQGIMNSSAGDLTQVAFTHRSVFDLKAETDVYSVAAGHRVDNRPQLHRLRPARQRGHERHLRRDAGDPR